jgi:phosphocarrier protein
VKTASRFKSAIHVSKDGLRVNGKSIMGVMMLAAERGSSMDIRAEGEDAELAMEALLALVAAGFNEMHLTGSEADLEDVDDDAAEGEARP